jgi:hypothetical protein
MTNKLLIFIFIILFSQISFSQKSTYLGFEGAVVNDIYNIEDPCNIIESNPIYQVSWGVNVEQELSNNFSIQTGIIRKYYDEGFGYTKGTIVLGYQANAFNTWQIPIRIISKQNLVKDKLFITQALGFHYSINSNYDYGKSSGGGSYLDGGDTISASYTVNGFKEKTFPLIEAGLGLELKIYDSFLISLSSSYLTGLKKVHQLDISTEGYGCSTNNAISFSKGSYWNIALGFKYAISNIWSKRKSSKQNELLN